MDTSSLLAKAHIAQSLAQQMKIGDDATISVPGVNDPVDAKVTLISPALDPGSTTLEIWLKVDNKKAALKVGTPVKVSITGRTVREGTEGSRLVDPHRAGRHQIRHGRRRRRHGAQESPSSSAFKTATMSQITKGLTTSDTVITSGSYGLDEGAKVKVGPAEDDDAKPAADKGGDKD